MASLQNSVPLHATVPRAESRTADFEPDRVELLRQRFSVERGHVYDEQVLHVGGAQFAAGIAFGKIGGRLHLFGRDSAAKGHRSDIRKTGLLLRMNADVVAVDVVGRMLFDRRIKLESDALLQFAKKTVGSPSMPQEKEFQAGALAMFAQHLGIAEQFGDAFD